MFTLFTLSPDWETSKTRQDFELWPKRRLHMFHRRPIQLFLLLFSSLPPLSGKNLLLILPTSPDWSSSDCRYRRLPRRAHRWSSATMPLTNGDILDGASDLLLPKEKTLDHSEALKILESEYKEKDGLSASTLLDSAKHGGLTYNDFLVLPGHIGMLLKLLLRTQRTFFNLITQASLPLPCPSIAQ